MCKMQELREQFPALKQKIHGHDLVYLDSAATSLKHQSVIDEIMQYYKLESSNIHRGVYQMSEIASNKYEQARLTVQNFIGAKSEKEIIQEQESTDKQHRCSSGQANRN